MTALRPFAASRRPFRRGALLAAILLGLVLSTPAYADGRLELNQASVEADGGFPLTLTAPGNYVLTSSLPVPAGVDGIVIATTDVVIDLNGFSIVGPATCAPGACAQGAGRGIRPGPSVAFGHASTVRNGTVRGFADTCVALGSDARVEDLHVRDCGGDGISVNTNGVVRANRVSRTGDAGIRMSLKTAYESNAVASAGLGPQGGRSYEGGSASGGNTCDDGGCAPRGERRYYLTVDSSLDGSEPASACDPGFHFASMFELLDVGSLFYDVTRGHSSQDSGSGPPSRSFGWVRTGKVAGAATSFAGGGSCLGYTDTSAGSGTVAGFSNAWSDNNASLPPSSARFWDFDRVNCTFTRRVWCIED